MKLIDKNDVNHFVNNFVNKQPKSPKPLEDEIVKITIKDTLLDPDINDINDKDDVNHVVNDFVNTKVNNSKRPISPILAVKV